MSEPSAGSPEGQPTAPTRSVAGAAGIVSVATMVSRVLGVVREMVMARYFGAGFFTDAFNIAFRIPNLLRDLFAEGALSSAFVPTFVRTLTRDGRERAWQLANSLISALLVILGALTLLIYFGARWFVLMLAAGYAGIPQKLELTVQMTRIMSPFLLFVALAAVLMGMANAFGSFFVPAMAPSAFNLCCILAGVFLSPFMTRWGLAPVVSMAIGAVLGGASQFLVQVPAVWGFGFRIRPVLDFSDPGLRQISKLMLPAIVGLSATQINITVDNQLASIYGNGPVSWLNYAFRLMQLPIGVFGVAIATATLARVSHHAAAGDLSQLRKTVHSSLRLAACLTFPATVGLILFRAEIVRLLYERGSFLATDTIQTGRVLLFYSLALFAYSAVKILVPTFYALQDTRTPVQASMTSIAAKIAINLILVLKMGYLGLALATASASWLNFALLMRELNRRTGSEMSWRACGAYFRILFASLVMGGISWIVFQGAQQLIPTTGSVGLGAALTLAVAAGIASLALLMHALHIDEIRVLAVAIGRRFAGAGK